MVTVRPGFHRMAGRQLDLDRAMRTESFQTTTDMPALGLAVCEGKEVRRTQGLEERGE